MICNYYFKITVSLIRLRLGLGRGLEDGRNGSGGVSVSATMVAAVAIGREGSGLWVLNC